MSTTPAPKPIGQPSPTIQAHRRQVAWQIGVPLGLTGLLFLAACVLVILGGSRSTFDTGLGMSVSAIFLLLPVIFTCLIFLAISAALIYLMAKFLGILPGYTRLAQYYAHALSQIVAVYAAKAIQPILAVHGFQAAVKRFFRRS
jgi:hypothetical protein